MGIVLLPSASQIVMTICLEGSVLNPVLFYVEMIMLLLLSTESEIIEVLNYIILNGIMSTVYHICTTVPYLY